MARRFEKWHGLGNDFIVADAAQSTWWRDRAVALCDRHLGIGADGVLLVDAATPSMAVVNADGSEPEMCGNGLRCVVGALGERAGAASFDGRVHTGAGWLEAAGQRVASDVWRVASVLGVPAFGARAVGGQGAASTWSAPGLGDGTLVSMGNPHWVFLHAPGLLELTARGAELEHDPRFPARTNVEFVEQTGPVSFTVNVWERGCGLTRACGTGAAAVAATLFREGRVPTSASLSLALPGGALVARQRAADGAIEIEGPAVRVFAGELPDATVKNDERRPG